jgi:hypothetical protein
MVFSADFENQKQYLDQKNIALSIYCNITCENRSSDKGLNDIKANIFYRQLLGGK